MAAKKKSKKLEIDSKYAHLDIDGDGVVSDEEMMREERMIELADKRSDMENEDKKQDAQRNMAWFALAGMLLYPFAVVLAVFVFILAESKSLSDVPISVVISINSAVPVPICIFGSELFAS